MFGQADNLTFGFEIEERYRSKRNFFRGHLIFYKNVKFFEQTSTSMGFYIKRLKIVTYFQNIY